MKKLLLFILLSLSTLMAKTLTLSSGWNLVGINGELTLEELKTQMGINNLLVVQGAEKVYKKAHVDANLPNLNDLTLLEKKKAYWIKIQSPANLIFTEAVTQQNSDSLALKEGWNLVSSPQGLTLNELIAQIGRENLLIVQGTDTTYQKSYIDQGFPDANDFQTLEPNKGYWIKVQSATSVEFLFNVDKVAVDNQNNPVIGSVSINNQIYTLRVFANTVPTQENSQTTLALLGTVNGINTQSQLKLNGLYTKNTAFQVRVYNGTNIEIAHSSNVKYITSPINFGAINFDASVIENDNSSNDVTLDGLAVFSQPLGFENYGLESITDSEFNALTPENQYKLAQKLLATLFYGLPKTELDAWITSGTFISTLQAKLNTPNTDVQSTEQFIADKDYSYWSRTNAYREKILARLFHMGLGKHYVRRWTAYILSQNILFSPANELESVNSADILGVYNRLVRLMDDDYSMEMITYLHMTSEENWRRFRSPEDNGREMLEIYTLDFNDSHVPKAAIALQNWRVTRNDYELVIGLNQNEIPQELFGTTVTTGFDFYREMVKSTGFPKGVITRLVKQYFPESSGTQKSQVINLIQSSNPKRFEDILLQIVFSKEYLLNNSKVKSIEETVFSLAKTISFYDARNFFAYMRGSMDNMHQSPLSYKLGRDNLVPLDTLSFAYYYDFVRRRVMNDTKNDNYNDWDSGWKQEFISKEIPNTNTINGLIDHIFMSVIGREPSTLERDTLAQHATTKARGTYNNIETYNDRLGITRVVMEYLSRLSELYRFPKIEE